MKIKEVISEGVLDYAKGLVKTKSFAGAKAASQSASQQAAGNKELQKMVDAVFQKWNTYTGGTGNTDIKSWANKFFNANVSSYPVPDSNNPVAVKEYLTNITKSYKAGTLKPLTAKPKARQRNQPPSKPTNVNQPLWNAKKKILSIDGQDYKQTAKGWVDTATNELIAAQYAGELNAAFDRATGRVPVKTQQASPKVVPQNKQPMTVNAPKGVATKNEDGMWYDENNEQIADPNDIKRLEQLALVKRQTAQMAQVK